jgi:hypothetical protein
MKAQPHTQGAHIERAHTQARPLSLLRSLAFALCGAAGATCVVGLIAPQLLLRQLPGASAAQDALLEDLESLRAAEPALRPPRAMLLAATAYEDRGYFARPWWLPPLSPTGLVRAALRNLRGIPEGGSTIPQQLAKLYLRGGRKPGLSDKLEEALFATWASRQGARDDLVALYLNLGAGASLGSARAPADGLSRLSLALLGLPLLRLGREDQLVLAGVPRGLSWLRGHPRLSAARVAAARAWLSSKGHWDASAPSYLDEDLASGELFALAPGWTESLASGGRADLDLVSAVEGLRAGLGEELARFPDARVRLAFSVVGPEGEVLARSGSESAMMGVNYGSIAKLEPLALAVEALGHEAVRAFTLTPAPCTRWIWSARNLRRRTASRYCPVDVHPAEGALSLSEAVARSINTTTVRHVAALPLLIERARPDLTAKMLAALNPDELAALDSPVDRALTANALASLGAQVTPDDVPARLAYSALEVALFRHLKERREEAGLPSRRLPDDPTSTLGNSSRATAEQIGGYIHRRLFEPGRECRLTDVGALLALERRNGTLRWLATRRPKLVFSGKTGSSPHDDAAVAAVALCLDGRPAVLVAAVRPVEGKLPQGLQGSSLLRGIDAYLTQLSQLGRRVESVALPPWAEAEAHAALPDNTLAGAGRAPVEEEALQ